MAAKKPKVTPAEQEFLKLISGSSGGAQKPSADFKSSGNRDVDEFNALIEGQYAPSYRPAGAYGALVNSQLKSGLSNDYLQKNSDYWRNKMQTTPSPIQPVGPVNRNWWDQNKANPELQPILQTNNPPVPGAKELDPAMRIASGGMTDFSFGGGGKKPEAYTPGTIPQNILHPDLQGMNMRFPGSIPPVMPKPTERTMLQERVDTLLTPGMGHYKLTSMNSASIKDALKQEESLIEAGEGKPYLADNIRNYYYFNRADGAQEYVDAGNNDLKQIEEQLKAAAPVPPDPKMAQVGRMDIEGQRAWVDAQVAYKGQQDAYNELAAQRDAIKGELYFREMVRDELKTAERFEYVTQNPDFFEKSGYQGADLLDFKSIEKGRSGSFDNLYNEATEAYAFINSPDYRELTRYSGTEGIRESKPAREGWDKLDPYQTMIFNYLYNSSDYASAMDFLAGLKKATNFRRAQESAEKWQEFGHENNVLAWVAARGLNVVDSLLTPAQILGVNFGGENAYSDAYDYKNAAQAIDTGLRENAARNWSTPFPLDPNKTWGEFLLETLTSTADSAVAIGIGKAAGAKGMSLGLMGSSAASDTFQRAIMDGTDKGTATALSISAFIIETLTEKFSTVDRLWKDPTKAIWNLAKSFAGEASEEMIAKAANTAVDMWLRKDNSELGQMARAIMQANPKMTLKEAESAARQQWGRDLIMEGIQGGISGLMMGIPQSGALSMSNYQDRATQRAAYPNALQEQINAYGGKMLPVDTTGTKSYAKPAPQTQTETTVAEAIAIAGEISPEFQKEIQKDLQGELTQEKLVNAAAKISEAMSKGETRAEEQNNQYVPQATKGQKLDDIQKRFNTLEENKANMTAEQIKAETEAIAQEIASVDALPMTADTAIEGMKDASGTADEALARADETQALIDAWKAKQQGKTDPAVTELEQRVEDLAAVPPELQDTPEVAKETEAINAQMDALGIPRPVGPAPRLTETGEQSGALTPAQAPPKPQKPAKPIDPALTERFTAFYEGQVKPLVTEMGKAEKVARETKTFTVGSRQTSYRSVIPAKAAPTIAEHRAKNPDLEDESFDFAAEAAYVAGLTGSQAAFDNSAAVKTLAPETAKALFDMGMEEFGENKAIQRAARGKLAYAMPKPGQGKLNVPEAVRKKMNQQQKGLALALQKVAIMVGIEADLFISDKVENGLVVGEEGSFDPATGRFRFDINAGINFAKELNNKEQAAIVYALPRVMGHEFTHYLKLVSPELFAQYQEAMIRELVKNNSLDDLVLQEMARGRKGDLTYDTALEEVIARSSEMMLRDTTFMQNVMGENPTLWEKFKAWVADFVKGIQERMKGMNPAYPAAKTLMETANGVVKYTGELQAIWDKAMTQSITDRAKAPPVPPAVRPAAAVVDEAVDMTKDKAKPAPLPESLKKGVNEGGEQVRFSERDTEYMKAVISGDMETAQKMVEAYAKERGYDTDASFRMMHEAPTNDGFNKPIYDMTAIYPSDFYEKGIEYYGSYTEGGHDYEAMSKLRKVQGKPDAKLWVYRAVPADMKGDYIRNGDWITLTEGYARLHGKNNIDGPYRIVRQMVKAKDVYTDANSIQEYGYDDGNLYAYANTKNNVKLLAPVAYEYNGSIIPLSKRFNKRAFQTRYSERPLAPILYSKMQQEIEGIKGKMSAETLIPYLRGRGVKADEIRWSGIQTFLQGKKSVTKDELAEFAKGNELRVEDAELKDAVEVVPEDMERQKKEYIIEKSVTQNNAYRAIHEKTGRWIASIDEVAPGMWERISGPIGEDAPRGLVGKEVADAWLQNAIERHITYCANYLLPRSTPKSKFGNYKLNNGTNYREVLFTVPDLDGNFQSAHWDEKNVLAHARMQDFSTKDGKPVLFVEEVQSDWHEKGREIGYDNPQRKVFEKERDDYMRQKAIEKFGEKDVSDYYDPVKVKDMSWDTYMAINHAGEIVEKEWYADNPQKKTAIFDSNKVAPAPFAETWHEYVLKRVLRMAAEGDYDYVAWTTGEMQAERYSLEKHISKIEAKRVGKDHYPEPRYGVSAFDLNGNVVRNIGNQLTKQGLVSTFGKDVADKIIQGGESPDGVILSGLDLKAGGEGMRSFYDIGGRSSQNIPRFLNKYAGQWGAKVQTIQMDKYTVPAVEVTEKMRDSVLYEGQPMYSERDSAGTVLSPQQAEYFKDSKVRDGQGRLLKVYHGTDDAVFTVFSNEEAYRIFEEAAPGNYVSPEDRNQGYYFSKDISVANAYSDATIDLWGKRVPDSEIDTYAPSKNKSSISGPANYEVYLNITNPLVIDARGEDWNKIPYQTEETGELKRESELTDSEKEAIAKNYYHMDAEEIFGGEKNLNEREIFFDVVNFMPAYIETTREIEARAYQSGYDGVIIESVTDTANINLSEPTTTVYIAFSPSQIKSVDNLTPTTDPDIRYSERDTQYMAAVNKGDMATAQKKVNQAAKAAGYTIKAYRGGGTRYVYDRSGGVFLTSSKEIADAFGNTGSYDKKPDTKPYFMNLQKPLMLDAQGRNYNDIPVFPDHPDKALVAYAAQAYDATDTEGRVSADWIGEWAQSHGYGSVVIKNVREGVGGYPATDYIVLNPENVKIADPVTYDNSGKPIPLNQRFNQKAPDNRYSERDPENSLPSARAILAGAFGNVAQTDAEKKRVDAYRKNADRYNRLEGELNNLLEKRRLLYVNKAPQTEKNEVRADINELKAKLDAADRTLLNLQASKPLRDVVARETEKAYEAYKERADERVAQTRQKMTDTGIRGKIRNVYLRLVKALANPTEKQYIPAQYVQPLIDVAEAIDVTGRSAYLADKIGKLKDRYEALKTDTDYSLSSEFDESILNEIKALQAEIGETLPINLKGEQLQRLYRVLLAVETTLTNARKLIASGIAKTNYEAADQIVGEVRAAKGIGISRVSNFLFRYTTGMLDARRASRLLSGYAQDGMLERLVAHLNDGQLKKNDFIMRGSRLFDFLMSGKDNAAQLRKFTGRGAEWISTGVKDLQGHELKITQAMRASMYMHTLNADNLKHLLGGGITMPVIELYKQGRFAEAFSRGNTFQLTEEQVKQIVAEMTDYEKAWTKAAQEFFAYATEKINETSMQLVGYKKAMVENYFPILSDRNFLRVDFESIAKDGSIEGMGFLKERVGSTNPMYLMDITSVLDRQLNNTAKYVGLAITVRNFNKVYRVSMKGFSDSVQKALNQVWGDKATKYLENLMADIQDARKNPPTFFDKAKGRFAQSVLALNPSVSLKQAASYPTAAAVVGWKPLLKALGRGGKKGTPLSRADQELIAKYTPLLWMRAKGMSTTELGDIRAMKPEFGAVSKLSETSHKYLLNWIQQIDVATVGRLWYASQYNIDESRPDLEQGTDEYYQEVAKLFNRVVEETQPDYTVMQRPDILRNPNAVIRGMTMFMTQRLQNFGILYDAAGELMETGRRLKADPNNESLKNQRERAGKQLNRAVFSQAVSALVLSMMTLLGKALLHRPDEYRDEDNQLVPGSIAAQVARDIPSILLGMVVGGAEMYETSLSLLTGKKSYGLQFSPIEFINDLYTSANNLLMEVNKTVSEGKDTKKLIDSATRVAMQSLTFMGVPVNNAKKIVDGIFLHYQDLEAGAFGSFEAGKGGIDKKTAYANFVEAFVAGDQVRMGLLTKELEDANVTESGIKTGIRAALKANYESGKIDRDTYIQQVLDATDYKSVKSNIIKEWFTEGEIDEAEAKRLLLKFTDDDEASEQFKTLESWKNSEVEDYSVYTKFREAVATGKDLRNVIKEYTDPKKYGYDNSTLKSEITRHFKDEYIEAVKAKRGSSLKGYLVNAFVMLGDTREYANKKIDNWLKP